MRQGVRAGIIAAAATLGTLLGFGRVRGAALQPLNAIAHMTFGTRAYLMDGFDPAITLLALLVHIASVLLWAVIFALLAGRLRGWRLVVSALLFGGIAWVTDHALVPDALSPGFEQVLGPVEVGVVYVVLALSLAAGIRLAAPRPDTI
ncbi:MAG TPA: hypothetical protein VF041_03075 [Gemmatimonadaceae bacterium]